MNYRYVKRFIFEKIIILRERQVHTWMPRLWDWNRSVYRITCHLPGPPPGESQKHNQRFGIRWSYFGNVFLMKEYIFNIFTKRNKHVLKHVNEFFLQKYLNN